MSIFVLSLDIIARIIIYPPRSNFTVKKNIEDSNNEKHNPLIFENLNFTMSDGYVIHGTIVYNKTISNKFVIYSHGWSNNRYSGLKYLDPYLNKGFNFFMYDLRGCGQNEKFLCSMGENESADLLEIIDLLSDKYGQDIQISLHGESLGSFSSLYVLKDAPQVKSCVSNCGYTSIKDVIKDNMKKHHISPIFYNPLQLYIKIRYNLNFNDYSALDSVSHSNTPLLIINGTEDTTVNKRMAKLIYDKSTSENKSLFYFDGAEHVRCQRSNPVRYKKIVENFLDSID
jgi:fermentation-respiration switch protein FrsA (DUF1100 family)